MALLKKTISTYSLLNWQHWLTKQTGNRVDFTRIATFIKTKNYRYTWTQLLTRASIIASTGVSAWAGYKTDDTDSKLITATWYGLAGFILSHTIVILPIITERHQLKTTINRLVSEIEKNINTLNAPLYNKRLNDILKIDKKTSNRAHATLTLKSKCRELNRLNQELLNLLSKKSKLIKKAK